MPYTDTQPDDTLQELKLIWFEQVQDECRDLAEALSALEREALQPPLAEELYRIFHDLQGQAGLFGYSLLATVSARFCVYWRNHNGKIGPQQLPVVRAHIVAARSLLHRKLEGNGGPDGTAILAELDAVTKA